MTITEQPTRTPLPWDNRNSPPIEEDSWPRCQGVGGECGVAYPPGWAELAWHLVHQCCRAEIEECPGEGCLCREPLTVIQHWCEACDGDDPRTCTERLNPKTPDPAEYKFRLRGCWYNDRRTHAARTEGIFNRITACDRYVNHQRAKERPRSVEITCEECVDALEQMRAAHGG